MPVVLLRSLFTTTVALIASCSGYRGPCAQPSETTTPPTEVGTNDPIFVLATSPRRLWASYCQARRDTDGDGTTDVWFGDHGEPYGDDLTPYVAYGKGLEREIDNYIAHDPNGRFLAVMLAGRLTLVDALVGTFTPLGPADPEVVYGERARRFAHFSSDGRKVLYQHGGRDALDALTVRDLCSGAERVVHTGADGSLYDATFDATTTRVVFAMQVPGADGTTPQMPFGRTRQWSAPCRHPRGYFGPAPKLVFRDASSEGGEALAVTQLPALPPVPPDPPKLVPEREPGAHFVRGPLHWAD